MSTENLVSNYEISVWIDEFDDNGNFVETRLGVIGSDKMESQSKVIEPKLTRKVNGEKKFSFKMYKKYIDNITGEKVDNIFCSWLVNEVKVKLYYEDKWYDFVVKNVQENSSTYLYTYSLEEMLVQELSKNGFGVTLDEKLMNNLGTAEELAKEVLKETDWEVESEVLVETVEESLVYVMLPKNGITVTHIKDQTDFSFGVDTSTTKTFPAVDNAVDRTIALAFYSSCKNKPHRFQFIILGDGKDSDYDKDIVSVDDKQNIQAVDCQYYYDISVPETGYEPIGDFYLPSGWSLVNRGASEIGDNFDTTVSNWYRGKRYGFAQKTEYVPLLGKYCNVYKIGNEEYYGYVKSDYVAPTFVQNVITNTDFIGTTGWVSSYFGNTPNLKAVIAPQIKSVYGRFDNNQFCTIEDDYKNAITDAEYKSYLQVYFPPRSSIQDGDVSDSVDSNGNTVKIEGLEPISDYGILINTGFYDNREQIENVTNGEEWYFDAIIKNSQGMNIANSFKYDLQRITYNAASGHYSKNEIWATVNVNNKSVIFNGIPANMTPGIFQQSEVKLIISAPSSDATYYIEKMELFPKVLNENNEVITPENFDTKGIVDTKIEFVSKQEAKEKTDTNDLQKKVVNQSDINYGVYIPVYNDGAAKVRTIKAKESNYFNILQTIAEKFEAWIEIAPIRDDNGRIIKKIVKFKNYLGSDNYAAFRYGVNLKDIKRTFESKKIVTKLIVKDNSNDLAENGFCSIARASQNPTGENYIYDFQYFHKRGLLSAEDYVASMYYATNPYKKDLIESGGDITEGESEYNTQNYINRIAALNKQLKPLNEDYANLSLELTKLEADKKVQENMLTAAANSIQEAEDKFQSIAGVHPENTSTEAYSSITCQNYDMNTDAVDIKSLNGFQWQLEDIDNTGAPIPYIDGQIMGRTGSDWQFDVEFEVKPNKSKGDVSHLEKPCDYIIKKYYSDERYKDAVRIWNGAEICKDGSEFDPGTPNRFYDILRSNLSQPHGGMSVTIKGGFKENHRYKLTYVLSQSYVTDSFLGESEENKEALENIGFNVHCIGGHNRSFKNTEIWLTRVLSSTTDKATTNPGQAYLVTVIGTYIKNEEDIEKGWNCFFIQPNRGLDALNTPTLGGETLCRVSNIKVVEMKQPTASRDRIFYLSPTFICTTATEPPAITEVTPRIACTIPAYSLCGTVNYSLSIVDNDNSLISTTLDDYFQYKQEYYIAEQKLGKIMNEGEQDESGTGLVWAVKQKRKELEAKEQQRDAVLDKKKKLNQAFYKQYSRFIQEGTWQSEDYVDANKYYTDALSVVYNSCFPQVAYTINVIAINKLPGYENFNFGLGDRTYAEDPDFFGAEMRSQVTITEIEEDLDDPSKNKIKVQNFKNNFQDLFQKITATVQQAQYNTGAYEKAAELANADAAIKGKFVTDGLSSMGGKLSVAGQTTVVQDESGITLTDSATKDQMRLIGGAILMSVEDAESGQRTWKTGLTPEGISASMVTTGTLNAGNIAIMNADEPTFRWDAFGISSFFTQGSNGIISDTNPYKFVRFDKYGVYGIGDLGNEVVDGRTWKPGSLEELQNHATFALTWDNLFLKLGEGKYHKYLSYDAEKEEITGEKILDTPVSHISKTILGTTDGCIYNKWSKKGKNQGLPYYDPNDLNSPRFTKVFSVSSDDGNEQLVIYDDGTLVSNNIKLTGGVEWTSASSPSKSVYASKELSPPADGTSWNEIPKTSDTGWHQTNDSSKDTYYAHTDDGGATWQGPFLITGKSIIGTKTEYASAIAGTRAENITSWSPIKPNLSDLIVGYNIYTKTYEEFNNGDKSEPRYFVEEGRRGVVTLSKSSINIPKDDDGDVLATILGDRTEISVSVRDENAPDGQKDLTDSSNLVYTWTIKNGTIDINSSKTSVKMTTITGNQAVISVSVSCGTMVFGTAKCVVTQMPVDAYITSSRGTLFDEDVEGKTKLTANMLIGLEEIDEDEKYFTYKWYKEQGENDILIASGKSIEVNISNISGTTLYFTVTPK